MSILDGQAWPDDLVRYCCICGQDADGKFCDDTDKDRRDAMRRWRLSDKG